MTKQNISAEKTMVTFFFTSTRLLVLNFLTKGTKFNQDDFIDMCFPIYTAKRDKLRGTRVCQIFQSTWTIQGVITAQR
jgi:hypothetical protein